MKDATAGARHPELGGRLPAVALTNFGYLANDVITTEEAVKVMRG